MRFNDKALIEISSNVPAIEGRLHHKRLTTGNFTQSGFKEKWCKLVANILFFFHLSETGKIHETKPTGALILENSYVQYETDADAPFAFSVIFKDETDKKHIFSGRTQEYINTWVSAMKCASYEFWRSRLLQLQYKICTLTGEDPLLMYPRNSGGLTLDLDQIQLNRSKSIAKEKRPTFQSYVPSKTPEHSSTVIRDAGNSKPSTSSNDSASKMENILEFDEDYFANSLERVGSLSWNKIESNTGPTRLAPPPPTRPPRSPKSDKTRQQNSVPTGNLIDL